MKKNGVLILILWGMAGCASAPKPPECKGEFKPVNVIEQNKAEISSTIHVVSCNEREPNGNKG